MGVANGGRAEYNKMKEVLEHPKTPSTKTNAIFALTNVKDRELAEETWNYMMTNSRAGDWMYFAMGLRAFVPNRRFLWNKFKENYEAIYSKLDGNFVLKHFVSLSFGLLSSREDHADVAAFFQDKDTSKYRQVLDQGLERMLSKAEWIERDTADLEGWLAKRNERI